MAVLTLGPNGDRVAGRASGLLVRVRSDIAAADGKRQ
jgi:hypothetical protein